MRQIQKTIKLKIPYGEYKISEIFTMPLGFVKSMVCYTNKREVARNETLEIALQDDASTDIIPLTHIDHFRQTGGEYEKSFKPLNFDSEGKKFQIIVNSDLAADNDLNLNPVVTIVFLMDTNVR